MHQAPDFEIVPLMHAELDTYRDRGPRHLRELAGVHTTPRSTAPLSGAASRKRRSENESRSSPTRPFPFDAPFAEVGPVYIHAEPCSGYTDTSRYPPDFAIDTGVPRIRRDNRIVDARLVAGEDADAA